MKRPSMSTEQRKYIFSLQKELDIDIDELREIAYDISGIASISRLSMGDASKLIERLVGKGNSKPKQKIRRKRRPQAKNVVYLVSKAQRGYILHLLGELKWNVERFQGFCKHQIKKEYPVTSDEASKVITGLEKMIKGDYGRDRFQGKEDAG